MTRQVNLPSLKMNAFPGVELVSLRAPKTSAAITSENLEKRLAMLQASLRPRQSSVSSISSLSQASSVASSVSIESLNDARAKACGIYKAPKTPVEDAGSKFNPFSPDYETPLFTAALSGDFSSAFDMAIGLKAKQEKKEVKKETTNYAANFKVGLTKLYSAILSKTSQLSSFLKTSSEKMGKSCRDTAQTVSTFSQKTFEKLKDLFYITHVQTVMDDDFSFSTITTKKSIFEVLGQRFAKVSVKKQTEERAEMPDLLKFKVENLISEIAELYKVSDFAKQQKAVSENPDAYALVPYEPAKAYQAGMQRSFEILKASAALARRFE